MAPKRQQVHVRDAEGRLLFTRLWDDGTNVLAFDGGSGYLDKVEVLRRRWTIGKGWPKTQNDKPRV